MATVLVVDDLADHRRFLVNLLGHHGYRMIEASNGVEGLAAIHAEYCDLVITDVLMPVMDGYEFVEQLRADPATAAIPVVFYTADYAAREGRALARAVGVSDVLTKPSTSAEVLRVVRRLLSGEPGATMSAGAARAPAEFERDHLRLTLSNQSTDLKRANARLRALINIGLECAAERDIDRLLRYVGDAARDLFGARYVTLGILNSNRQTVQRIIVCGAGPTDIVKAGESISRMLRTVVEERRTCRGTNPDVDPARLCLPWMSLSPHAFLVAPIASSADVYGWICLVSTEGRAFAEDDEDLVLALAGQVGRVYEIEHDILERQAAEAALGTTEERMRFALDVAGVGVSGVDSITRRLQSATTLERQSPLTTDAFAGPFEALERYRQAQKMETVGRLAGGVAHDFNNLLTVILGYCDLLLAGERPHDPRDADIGEIQKAAKRAGGLTRRLLAFSRKQIIDPGVLDLGLLVFDVQSMLERLIAEDIRIVLCLTNDPALVMADRGEVEQVVMNLAVNARDAMPKGGTLTIETATVDLTDHETTRRLGLVPGPYVRLTVTDTGTGITPQVQARLFEPFFTTKETGKGTGLGLATVYGIVTRSGGAVSVDSEVGSGSSFNVFLPRSDAVAPIAAGTAPFFISPGGTETVLLVEDEDDLRELTRRLLERQGYTVLIAANADEALHVFAANAAIDLVVTDIVMPGTSGPDLARQLVDERPALKVVYMSGYTEDVIVHNGVLNSGIAFLNKPFTSEALGRKIRQVLER